jgi:GT2 family glycosyltransferase
VILNKSNNSKSLGIVVIGRNEGKRLSLSLQSMQESNCPIVYVDSGSKDDSVSIANPLADIVHCLDNSRPFSAARARNEGFDVLMRQFPDIQYVQFIDGDCVVAKGWFDAAIETLTNNKQLALVLGHRRELRPNLTIYNRLCAMEWNSPLGELKNFGGLIGSFCIRTEVFREVGGFKINVLAGEDSELGVRMSLAGYGMMKIDHHMETHDANMLKFSQWWSRSVRAGHAIGQRAFLNGDTVLKDCVRERKSTLFWGVFLPMLALILLIPTRGFSLVIVLAYIFLGIKVYLYRRKQGESFRDAMTYAGFIVIGKFANGLGLIKFFVNNLKERYEIIEYK